MHHTITSFTFNQMPIMDPVVAAAADPNNNNRSSRSSASSASNGSGSGCDDSSKKDEKYSLRQRQTRKPTPMAKPEKKAPPKEKPKQKAPPLSKYRRKTANARERTRMREINSAFENLRKAVPIAVAGASGNSSPVSSPGGQGMGNASEKLTKITTLRMAMKYIRILNDILNNTDSSLMMDNNNEMEMVNHNEIEREVMLKGLLLSESMFKPVMSPQLVQSVKQAVEKGTGRKSNSSSAASKKKPKKSSSSKVASSKRSSQSRAKQNVIKMEDLAPSLEPKDDLMDLGMMLDSDNDSLHLSEGPCLSPLQGNGAGLKQTFNSCNTTVTSASAATANELEFGLFLESDADSLQLSEPCLSPLSHLDSLNPFNDLLHTGFNEQTALELYL